MQRKKNRKEGRGRGPLIRLVGLNAAVATVGLAGPAVQAAPGDLDPAFGDVGRQATQEIDWWTSLESMDVAADDAVLFGGGGEYCYWGCYEGYFLGSVLPDGSPDPGFVAPQLGTTVVRDTALQPDGKLVGVGRTKTADGTYLQVFRVLGSGVLDAGFGVAGLATLPNDADNYGEGLAVLLDPDGRIVVAGARGKTLFVARFLANGTLDPAFATAGIFTHPYAAGVARGVRLARAAGGGYRVLAPNVSQTLPAGCDVRGLTTTGTVEAGFGQGGVVTVRGPAGAEVTCGELLVQADGKMLLGGSLPAGNAGFLVRLLADGTPDPGFDATEATSRHASVSALGLGTDGSIVLGGTDPQGSTVSLVTRVGSSGALDRSFGGDGTARIEFETYRPGWSSPGDLRVLADGRVVLAGNAVVDDRMRAYVARLLGPTGAGPGVLSIKEHNVRRAEQQGSAVVTVRRSGGRAGATAVTYAARGLDASNSATPGTDFTAVTGQLTWADGDDGEREIVVPLLADTAAESPEFFEVVLSAPEGGAGLGTTGAQVEIGDLGFPHGVMTLSAPTGAVEGGVATFRVSRNFYAQGDVSVTVRVASDGTATPGEDFTSPNAAQSWQDVTLTWPAGSLGERTVLVNLRRDTTVESAETFSLELVSPTGGAVLGSVVKGTTTIYDDSMSGSGGGGGDGGGGAWGELGALLLGLAGFARRWRPRVR